MITGFSDFVHLVFLNQDSETGVCFCPQVSKTSCFFVVVRMPDDGQDQKIQ
jgi:hypothetical protein